MAFFKPYSVVMPKALGASTHLAFVHSHEECNNKAGHTHLVGGPAFYLDPLLNSTRYEEDHYHFQSDKDENNGPRP